MWQSTESKFDLRFTETEYADLNSIGTVIRFPAGSVLVADGDDTDFVLVLTAGCAKVVKGMSKRTVALRGPGDTIGEMAANLGKPRSANVVALTDVSTIHIPGNAWTEFLRSHPEAMFKQLLITELRLDDSMNQTAASVDNADLKLVKTLIGLVTSGIGEERHDSIDLRFNQKQLASLAGISRESVVGVIRQLKAAGIVATARHVTRVLDLDALKAIADDKSEIPR